MIDTPEKNKDSAAPSVSVVIPALNEASTIGDVISRILALSPAFEVIVVDDGSTDDTSGRARQAGARVIRHPYNLGNGASVKAGCLAANGEVIVMIDGDGQHPPEAIAKLLEWIGEFDMVVAARTPDSNTLLIRNVGNFVLNWIGSWICGKNVSDLTSGFRAIKRQHLLEYVHLFPSRYSYPTTITMAMILGNHFVKYLPVPTIHRRIYGKSNLRPIQDFIRFLHIMARLVIVFSPQRFFLPLSFATMLFGTTMAIYQIANFGAVLGSSLLLLISTIIFFCFGLIAEQIAAMRRERRDTFHNR
jgi:glycosyltransferase involved in cell wall biosynthesis